MVYNERMQGDLNMKRTLIACTVACALVPALAFADESDLLAQITALKLQVKALQEQLRLLTSQVRFPALSIEARPTIAPWDTFLARDPGGVDRLPETFTLEPDTFTASDAATSTPLPTTCTTPWQGTTVPDGASVLAQPDFTNGLRSASGVPPVMRCDAGQWLTCD